MEIIDCNVLNKELSKFGTVEVIKVGIVLTILMTGTELNHSIFKVLEIVKNWQKGKFPIVEILKNRENFILIILKT